MNPIQTSVYCILRKNENALEITKLHYALKSIQPSSVESERCFSTCGIYDTKIRSQLGDETLSALLFLNKQFKKSVHKGSRLEKLDQLEKPKDPKPNPAIEKIKKTQTIKKMFASASQSKQEQKDPKSNNFCRSCHNEKRSS